MSETASHPRPSLPALTAVRAFSAVNILLFHFSNPHDFGPFAAIVDGGYVAVSFFFILSGYIMAYNYGDRAIAGKLDSREFWSNRLARLYPVYILGLLISWQMLQLEWQAQSHGMFFTGLILTPLMLQAWHPVLATFWSTPAWALSVEIFLYACFPWLARIKGPRKNSRLLWLWWGVWACGMILPLLYIWLKPDGMDVPNRFSGGWWLRALKFFPVEHLPTFLCGVLLARIQVRIPAKHATRIFLALFGIAGWAGFLVLAYHTQERLWLYPVLHDPLMVPFYACIIYGLSADHWLAWLIARPALVAVGEASYCLYILHFNIWEVLHDHGLLAAMRLSRWDPWISYVLILAVAMLAYRFIELPARGWLRSAAKRRLAASAVKSQRLVESTGG
jgi:peptidoglycan/LPS O-acetylase OafA/YrhL